MASVSFAVVL